MFGSLVLSVEVGMGSIEILALCYPVQPLFDSNIVGGVE